MPTLERAPAKESSEGQRLSESVYEQIIQMIITRELESGCPVSESELSRRLDVSRTPIHEAVNRLVKDGLIIQERNRRPVVAAFNSQDVFDIYEMRRLLESEAAAKAADRIDKFTLAELRDAGRKFKSAKGSVAKLRQWVEFDDQFHSAIARACGNPRLEADIERYRLMHRVFNMTHTNAEVLSQAYAEHMEILTALEERDAEAARVAMQTHLTEWQCFFVQHLG